MNIVRRIAKNTSTIIFGKIISETIGAASSVLFARYIGPSGLGVYSFIFSYLIFFSIVRELGVDFILTREMSRNRDKIDILIGNAIILKVVLSIASLILACSIISFFNYDLDLKFLIYISTIPFLTSFYTLYGLIFRVRLQMGYPVLSSIINNLTKFIIFISLIILKAPLLYFIIAVVVSFLPGVFITVKAGCRYVKPIFKIDPKLIRYILKESFPMALVSVCTMIYFRVDQLMIFNMIGSEQLGYYSAATKLPEVLVIIPSAFMMSMFPLMSQYFKTSKESLVKSYKLSFKYLLMIIIPIAMGASILARPIILFIYGERFLSSAAVLPILTWAVVFSFYGLIYYEVLISVNRQRLYLIFAVTGALINIIFNLILIPKYGIIGASIATLISYIFSSGALLGYLFIKTREYSIAGGKAILKPLFSSMIMSIPIYFLRERIFLAILSGAVVFFISMFVFNGFGKEDSRILKNIIYTR